MINMYLNDNYPLERCKKINKLIDRYKELINNIDISINNVENEINIRKKIGRGDSVFLKIRRERVRLEYIRKSYANNYKSSDVSSDKGSMREKVLDIRLWFVKKLDNFLQKKGFGKETDLDICVRLYGILNDLIDRKNKYILDIEYLRKQFRDLSDAYFSDKVKSYQKSKCAYCFNPDQSYDIDICSSKNSVKSKIYRR